MAPGNRSGDIPQGRKNVGDEEFFTCAAVAKSCDEYVMGSDQCWLLPVLLVFDRIFFSFQSDNESIWLRPDGWWEFGLFNMQGALSK